MAIKTEAVPALVANWAAIPSKCRILEEDPDLAEGLSDEDRAAATRALVAPVIETSAASWDPPEYNHQLCYGLLILEGLMGRRLKVGSAVATELLSAGDIVRPGDEPTPWKAPTEIEWRVFRPARLALLDEHVTTMMGRRPQLVVNFSARLVRRLRSVAYLTAVSHQTRVEDKLLATLWHLANDRGRVTPSGIRIPFRLTHEVLGEIVGAQRPSVTTAMRRLVERGLVGRGTDGTYVLRPAMSEDPVAAAVSTGTPL